jgi:hypothetical protein
MPHESIPANRKALKINLDTAFYGSFAEIGGGQEVARHFFQAGAASGTVARTISAYDKRFSDVLYDAGHSDRYVSEERLLKMLGAEFRELQSLLAAERPDACFFAFADTVEILNYAKSNYAHGWMGIRYQLHPGGGVNTVIMHIKLTENDGLLQQKTLGILGVNLIYACKYYYNSPNIFLQSLTDNLSTDRFRITMMQMSGPDLDYVDNRLLGVQLVQNGMTHAIMFDRNGQIRQPSDMLYKKNVLAFRGTFRPITHVTEDILERSMELFRRDEDYEPDNTYFFCEITLNNVLTEGVVDARDFLERVDMLNAMGQNVMVSDFREYYKLVEFFSNFKLKKLRVVVGVPTLEKILDKQYYSHLRGGIMEALGKLFPDNMKLYIYPTLSKEYGELVTSASVKMEKDVQLLFEYLRVNRFILDLVSGMTEHLHITSHEVLEMIRKGQEGWEEYVPAQVAGTIKEKKLFGYAG